MGAHVQGPNTGNSSRPTGTGGPRRCKFERAFNQNLNYALNATNTTQLIVANDVLFTLNRVRDGATGSLTWSPFKLSEDRFTMFIRRALKKPAVNVDAGFNAPVLVG